MSKYATGVGNLFEYNFARRQEMLAHDRIRPSVAKWDSISRLRAEEILKDVHVLSAGSNAYLITNRKVMLIDNPMLSPSRILGYMEGLGLKPTEIKLIVCTHYHLDHTRDLAEWKRLTGAKLAAGEGDVDYIEKKKIGFPRAWDEERVPAHVDIKLRDGDMIPEALGGLRVIGVPGHSPGSIALYSAEHKILFSGDALQGRGEWNRLVGTLHHLVGAPPWEELEEEVPEKVEAAYRLCLESIKKLSNLEFEALLSGHSAFVDPRLTQMTRELVKGPFHPRSLHIQKLS